MGLLPKGQPSTSNTVLEDKPRFNISDTMELALNSCDRGGFDSGYNDAYAGYYDVQGCGVCRDYCRWVGNSGSGGDPSVRLEAGSSLWSCALAGANSQYSPRGHFTSWSFTKCG